MYLQDIIPAPTSSPADHGLVKTALPSPADGTDTRWEMGFEFTPETCDEPESWIIPCVGTDTGGPGATITENRGDVSETLTWTPFYIRAAFKCDARSIRSIDFEQRARSIYALGESKLIETELWRGDAAGWTRANGDPSFTEPNLTLAQAGVTDLAGGAGASSPVIALRSLVQAAAGAPGGPTAMLHATPAVVTAWMQSGGLTETRDGKLVTKVGKHWVVSGTGYSGEGPGVVAAGANESWAYVTTPVFLLRGPTIEILWDGVGYGQVMNREDNDVEVIAQRAAAYYWDGCLHAGMLVDENGASI